MKVQRCHACGARYNADRLEVGTVFDCNRCGAAVSVEGTSPVSVALLLAGFLVLAAVFLWSPTARTSGLLKPWEEFEGTRNLLSAAGTGLWALLGLWAVVTAMIPGARARSVITVALGALALVLATTEAGGGFPIVVSRSLLWMLGVVALGAGFLLVGRGYRGVAPTALLLGGGLWILLGYTLGFSSDGQPLIQQVHAAVTQMLDDPNATTGQLLELAGTHAALLLAAGGGLLVGLGLRARLLATAFGILLVIAMLLPGAIRIGDGFDGEFAWGRFAQDFARGAGMVLVRDGVALWAILSYAAVDLVRARGGTA